MRAAGRSLSRSARAAAARRTGPIAPLSLANGRVTVGGDATLTVGTNDPGYFNFTDYERSALRLVRFDAVATLRANAHLSCLAELRAEGDSRRGPLDRGRVRRVRARAAMDGPRVRGAGGAHPDGLRRVQPGGRTAATNLLIGYPLAYQYLTSLRADAVPRTADDLVAMRGRGWYAHYPVGADYWDHGVPADERVQVRHGRAREGRAAGGPHRNRRERHRRARCRTPGWAMATARRSSPCGSRRVRCPACWSACPARAVRSSSRSVRDVLPEHAAGRQYRQRAFGADAEVSHGYWLVRTELVSTDWRLPALGTPAADHARCAPRRGSPRAGTSWRPGCYAAARYDRMFFSRIASSRGSISWDAESLAGGSRAAATRCAGT